MLFGTSGIRGLYGKDVNEGLAMKITNLFAEKKVVVARDTRTTGESLAFACISGALGKGCDAVYLGIVPTPTLALATKKHKCRGIMITASHNPSEYNGIKLYENGEEIPRKMERELEKRHTGEKAEFTGWDKIGKKSVDDSAISEHISLIKKNVDTKLIANRKPKVVVDANGAGTVITAKALRELGCEVIELNNQVTGFARASEPNAENLKGLAAKVLETNSDLGIGHDGDADRAVVVDDKGDVLALDVQLAIMCRYELWVADAKKTKKENKNKLKIVSTVEASLCVREAVEANDAEILITPVGSLYVSEVLVKEKAVFGGEPCGEYVFSSGLNVPDGILTAAKFVEIFCRNGKLSELKAEYMTYPMVREKFSCDNDGKYEMVKQIADSVKIKGTKNSEDGLRIDENDGWFLIRASGTEPFVRLTMEYKNKEKLEKRKNELVDLIMQKIAKPS
jgi:phosphoglucosamine mutase